MAQQDALSGLENITWLSELVQAETKTKYPQLVPPPWRGRLTTWFRKVSGPPVIRASLVWVLFLLINELLVAYGIVFVTYSFDAQGVGDVLASFIDIVAAILGIVIPLTILIIEFLGRDSSEIIDVYLDKTEIKTTALSALVVLALDGLAKLITQANLVSSDRFYFYMLALLLLLDLAVLAGVGIALNRVRQSLSSDFLIQAFFNRFAQEVRSNQLEQARYRYGRVAQINLGRLLELTRWPYLKAPQDAVPLVASKSGMITDIRIPKLMALGKSLSVRLSENPATRGYVAKLLGDVVSEGTAVIYVASNEQQEAKSLQRMLDQSLRIEKETSRTGRDITRLLSYLKQMALTAVRDENDELFDELLRVYTHVFYLGIDLPAPPSPDLIPDLFRGWSVMTTATFDLREIIDVAARSNNERLIGKLAFSLTDIVEEIIDHSDIYISESLRDVLGLFVTIYAYAWQHKNKHGMAVAFSFLTNTVVDHAWAGKFETAYMDQAALDNLRHILFAILYTLAEILRLMINYQDTDNMKELLNKIQPSEFLSRFDFILRPVQKESWDLQRRLQSASEDDAQNIRSQLETRQAALKIPQEVIDFFSKLIFMTASYIVEGYDHSEFDVRQAQELLQAFRSHFPSSLDRLVNTLEKLLNFSEREAWISFHRHPDTKRVFSPDDHAKNFLFYSMHGLKLLAAASISPELPFENLQYRLGRVEEFCNYIAKAPDKWSAIAEIDAKDIPALAIQFMEFNKQAAEKWQRNREEQIIAADLDPAKVSAFQEAVKNARDTAPSLRPLLEAHNRILRGVRVPGKKVWGFDQTLSDKEHFTSLYPEVTQAKDVGEEYGRGLAATENGLLVSTWSAKARTLRTSKDWQSLESYMERALKYMDENGYKASLVVIPNTIRYEFLSDASKFRGVYYSEYPVSLPNLCGFYDEIPVLQWPETRGNAIIVIDVAIASQLEIQYEKIEAKLLPSAIVEQMLKDDPQLDERQLQLSVWIKVLEKVRVRILDKNAIVRLPVKLPENMLIRRPSEA